MAGGLVSPLVFLDVESTGLDPVRDEVWEVAAVRYEPDGRVTFNHSWFVEHSLHRTALLPAPFRADHDARYDARRAMTQEQTAAVLVDVFRPHVGAEGPVRPHLVGAVPSFDEAFLRRLLKGSSPWHYHLVDVETLAVGFLAGEDPGAWQPPWRSDDLTRALGLEPPAPGVRHTAMGDVDWTIAVYDAVLGLPRPPLPPTPPTSPVPTAPVAPASGPRPGPPTGLRPVVAR
jgi:hypothetical protein